MPVRGPRALAAATVWRSICTLTVESDPVETIDGSSSNPATVAASQKRIYTGVLAAALVGLTILSVVWGVCGTQTC
jgi:hypothetical protein